MIGYHCLPFPLYSISLIKSTLFTELLQSTVRNAGLCPEPRKGKLLERSSPSTPSRTLNRPKLRFGQGRGAMQQKKLSPPIWRGKPFPILFDLSHSMRKTQFFAIQSSLDSKTFLERKVLAGFGAAPQKACGLGAAPQKVPVSSYSPRTFSMASTAKRSQRSL